MDKFLQLLGLIQRSNNLISGEEMVTEAIKKNKVSLVILGNDVGINTKKKILDKSNTYNVEVIQYKSSEELGSAIGKPSRVVLGIKDVGFSKKLKSLIKK